jgi:hypothetical protein
MHLSISSFSKSVLDGSAVHRSGLDGAGSDGSGSDRSSSERLTAADRPGVAQPVPERPVPQQPWRKIFASVCVLVLAATAAWEWRMRSLELLPGDIDEGASWWAEQRRKLGDGPNEIAIVGDSRILFGTDLAQFEKLTGVRPLQLALPGTNARPFLEDLGNDPNFHGLAIVGIMELSYFRSGLGRLNDALGRYRHESPAQRSSFLLHRMLSRVFGFLDDQYRLSVLTYQLDDGWRANARSPYDNVWKVEITGDRRQSALWPRLEHDTALNAHARATWLKGQPAAPDQQAIDNALKLTAAAVKAIRARGGDVVFLRPPSSGELRKNEDLRLPRQRGWDALLAAAQLRGLHADDDPLMATLTLPEMSHVSRACATVYTDAYVRGVVGMTDKIHLRADAPPPLTGADCLQTPGG